MDIGAQLRTAREARSLSIATLAERTRVPARTLSAIERNDQSALPPHPFGRGFVRNYAEELDLDPERIVRDFFAQFPGQPDTSRAPVLRQSPDVSWQPPSQWMGMATAVAILLVVVAAAVVLGRRSDSTPTTGSVGTTGGSVGTTGASAATPVPTTAAPATPQPVDQPDRTAAPAVAAPPAPGAISVVLSLTGPCWVAATVDGRRTIYQILQPGERHTLVAEREMTIRFGDAGAVAWTINGRDPGTPGANGAVRDVRIDRENAATVR